MLPIYVITVGGDTERRCNAGEQLKALGVDFRFFDGYGGASGELCFDAIDAQQFLLNTGKRPLSGEIGCFASHKTLWQKCVDGNRPIMIMEDDFRLAENFPDALHFVAELIDEVQYIRLQRERRARSTPVASLGDFQLERYTKLPHCAMCYAVTPRVARRLLAMSRVFDAPVDVVMKRVWLIRQAMFCLTPYTVSDSPLCYQSTIGLRERCAKPPGVRLQRTFRKLGWLLQQWHFNLTWSDRPLQAFCKSWQMQGKLQS